MSEKIKIECLREDIKKSSEVEIWENDSDVEICFRLDELIIIKNGENFFETLIEIRKELETKKIKMFCKGCNKNVYPSAMILSMGSGRKAYSLTLGQQAKMDSLVDIFDKSNLEEYASVEEQNKFYEIWLKSLRS